VAFPHFSHRINLAFDKSKKEYGAYQDDSEDNYSEAGREQVFQPFETSDDLSTVYELPRRKPNGEPMVDDKGNPVTKESSPGDLIRDITIDKNNKSGKLTRDFLLDIGNVPQNAFSVSEDFMSDTQRIQITDKNGNTKEFTFKMDASDDDALLPQKITKVKEVLNSMVQFYHYGESDAKEEDPDKELDPNQQGAVGPTGAAGQEGTTGVQGAEGTTNTGATKKKSLNASDRKKK